MNFQIFHAKDTPNEKKEAIDQRGFILYVSCEVSCVSPYYMYLRVLKKVIKVYIHTYTYERS